MKKASFIAASISTAGLLAAGAAAIAHFAVNANPVEEANASEGAAPAAISSNIRVEDPPVRPRATEASTTDARGANWGVLSFMLGIGEPKQERAAPSRSAERGAAPAPQRGDDDDDDRGDD